MLPQELSGSSVEAEGLQSLGVRIGAGDEHVIFPDNRRAGARARKLGGPGDVLGEAPALWQVRLVRRAVEEGTSEVGPVARSNEGCDDENRDDTGDSNRHHVL